MYDCYAFQKELQMARTVGLIASLLLAGPVTMLAQSHDQTHAQGRHHDQSSHDPIDPQLHAAMHELIGTWTGPITSDGGPAQIHLTAANDVDGRLTLTLASNASLRVGAARDVALSGYTVRWTQALGDASCAATASLKDVTARPSGKLKGTLACDGGKMTFALDKAKE
jgi:hypothetical protein